MSKGPLLSKEQMAVAALLERPENRFCVDCGQKSPKWASLNLGCFMCIECSGLHRLMGTHITKVRSTTLDKWEQASVDFMSKSGNVRVNAIFESNLADRNRKPRPTATMDERERYIRMKYERRAYYAQPNRDSLSRACGEQEMRLELLPAGYLEGIDTSAVAAASSAAAVAAQNPALLRRQQKKDAETRAVLEREAEATKVNEAALSDLLGGGPAAPVAAQSYAQAPSHTLSSMTPYGEHSFADPGPSALSFMTASVPAPTLAGQGGLFAGLSSAPSSAPAFVSSSSTTVPTSTGFGFMDTSANSGTGGLGASASATGFGFLGTAVAEPILPVNDMFGGLSVGGGRGVASLTGMVLAPAFGIPAQTHAAVQKASIMDAFSGMEVPVEPAAAPVPAPESVPAFVPSRTPAPAPAAPQYSNIHSHGAGYSAAKHSSYELAGSQGRAPSGKTNDFSGLFSSPLPGSLDGVFERQQHAASLHAQAATDLMADFQTKQRALTDAFQAEMARLAVHMGRLQAGEPSSVTSSTSYSASSTASSGIRSAGVVPAHIPAPVPAPVYVPEAAPLPVFVPAPAPVPFPNVHEEPSASSSGFGLVSSSASASASSPVSSGFMFGIEEEQPKSSSLASFSAPAPAPVVASGVSMFGGLGMSASVHVPPPVSAAGVSGGLFGGLGVTVPAPAPSYHAQPAAQAQQTRVYAPEEEQGYACPPPAPADDDHAGSDGMALDANARAAAALFA